MRPKGAGAPAPLASLVALPPTLALSLLSLFAAPSLRHDRLRREESGQLDVLRLRGLFLREAAVFGHPVDRSLHPRRSEGPDAVLLDIRGHRQVLDDLELLDSDVVLQGLGIFLDDLRGLFLVLEGILIAAQGRPHETLHDVGALLDELLGCPDAVRVKIKAMIGK